MLVELYALAEPRNQVRSHQGSAKGAARALGTYV
jgi:hypothetical protein